MAMYKTDAFKSAAFTSHKIKLTTGMIIHETNSTARKEAKLKSLKSHLKGGKRVTATDQPYPHTEAIAIGVSSMNISTDQTGYTFSATELAQIDSLLKRTNTHTGVDITYSTGKSGGFAASMIGINDQSLGYKNDVVFIQSCRDSEGVLAFGVLSAADREPLSDDCFFGTLLEALAVADVFLRRIIGELKAKRPSQQTTSSAVPSNFANNVIASKVLSPDEVHYVQSYANQLGKLVGLQGFAKFVESDIGFVSIALGLVHNDAPIMFGTVVVVSDETGKSCTVRDLKNKPMPGPDMYPNIDSALRGTHPFFENMAKATAKHVRPNLWRRLFG